MRKRAELRGNSGRGITRRQMMKMGALAGGSALLLQNKINQVPWALADGGPPPTPALLPLGRTSSPRRLAWPRSCWRPDASRSNCWMGQGPSRDHSRHRTPERDQEAHLIALPQQQVFVAHRFQPPQRRLSGPKESDAYLLSGKPLQFAGYFHGADSRQAELDSAGLRLRLQSLMMYRM